jgi:putative redox protein
MAKAHVTLREGYRTTITSGHHVTHADEPVADGGTDTGPSPTEMLMGALGSCIAMTMKMYAERKGWPLTGVDISLDFERFSAKDYPAYTGNEQFIHEIHEHIILHGLLDADQKARLLEIAKKCPVSRVIELPTFWQQMLVDALPE